MSASEAWTSPAAGPLEYESIKLRSHPLGDVVGQVRDLYIERFGENPEPGGWYHRDDWHRIAATLELLDSGGDLLDVGVGAGQFLNALALSGRFRSVTGLDRIRFNKYTEFAEGITRHDGSIAELPFADDSFDVVTCMEVLEHLPDEVYATGLAELRRVCRGQLIMTVPYREPEPIYSGHVRRYEDGDIAAHFPNGSLTLLDRPKMPWMLIEERYDGQSPRTATVSTAQPPAGAARPNALGRVLRRLRNIG